MKKCSFEGCTRPYNSKGLCAYHYKQQDYVIERQRQYRKKYKLTHERDHWKPHPLYAKWNNMIGRCERDSSSSYRNYRGKGIAVCDEWRESYESFKADMESSYKDGLTLERLDNSKGYSKSNCIWADRTRQAVNRSKFSNNTSGVTGIIKLRDGHYRATLSLHGKAVLNKQFKTIQEAVVARRTAEKLYFQPILAENQEF